MARKRSDASDSTRESGGSDLREALSQLLDPRASIVLTRERIEDALQDAVSRGRVTADDAQDLVASLLERGRRQTQDLLGELERLVSAKASRGRGGARAPTGGSRVTATRGGGGSARGAKRAPFAGYADLTAVDVRKRLDGLTTAQLRAVRDYERANANRKTVLEAVERKLRQR